jgi:hypothetical protein
MKKIHSILLTALLVIGLVACSTPAETSTPSFVATTVPIVVKFVDPVLEEMVRGAMGKTEGDITLAEAQAVTRMDLNNEFQRYISKETLIKDLSGLENFTSLETLDLSNHAVSDISPLAGLTKLTALSLAGNPVADVSPLAGLTNLKVLILSGSQAQDYSALANLVNLEVLLLDNSTISDVFPLASLTNLQTLYLDNSRAEDFSSLETIYTTLVNKDFIIPYTLKDLGFNLDLNRHEATYESEDASFTINHEKWGPPSREDNLNIIRMSLYMNDVYKVSIGYYSVHKVYVVQIDKEGEQQANYLYYLADGSPNLSPEDLTNAEQMVRGAMDLQEGEDVLAAPIHFYNDTVKNTFKMTPEKLFTLPYEPPTLKSLGFVPDETPGIYMYEQHEGIYTNIRIDHNEKENKEYDVVFFQPITDVYRVNLFYHTTDNKLFVGADDNYNGGASFYYYLDTGEHIDEWCSDPDKTVEEYFIKAYNDPAIEDVYQHTVDLMVQYIRDTFGMTIEELYALPTGE